MTSSRWQSEESYEPIRSMDRIQLAWEFLRRNPDYRRDYRNAVASNRHQPDAVPSTKTGVVIDPVWGLSYCLGSQTWCAATTCVLVPDDPCRGCAVSLY
jgi:hypothetical protein